MARQIPVSTPRQAIVRNVAKALVWALRCARGSAPLRALRGCESIDTSAKAFGSRIDAAQGRDGLVSETSVRRLGR
jgi:hypothetical protein